MVQVDAKVELRRQRDDAQGSFAGPGWDGLRSFVLGVCSAVAWLPLLLIAFGIGRDYSRTQMVLVCIPVASSWLCLLSLVFSRFQLQTPFGSVGWEEPRRREPDGGVRELLD